MLNYLIKNLQPDPLMIIHIPYIRGSLKKKRVKNYNPCPEGGGGGCQPQKPYFKDLLTTLNRKAIPKF